MTQASELNNYSVSYMNIYIQIEFFLNAAVSVNEDGRIHLMLLESSCTMCSVVQLITTETAAVRKY